MEPTSAVFTFRLIGTVHSPYLGTRDVPKGWGAEHVAEGTIEILPEYEAGLQDIEEFSHLYVIWVFDEIAPPRLARRRRGTAEGSTLTPESLEMLRLFAL